MFLAIRRIADIPDLHYANSKSEQQQEVDLTDYGQCCMGSCYGCPQDIGIRSSQILDTTFVRVILSNSMPFFARRLDLDGRGGARHGKLARESDGLCFPAQDANSNLLNDIGRKGQNRLIFSNTRLPDVTIPTRVSTGA
jgi:hypothetical protein